MGLSARTRLAAALGEITGASSRLLHRGNGSVIGAKVILSIAPRALDELAEGRRVAVVTGTNGKSTTTALLSAACRAAGLDVATNSDGANLRSGVVVLLSRRRSRQADLAVLEIDELAMPALLPSFTDPLVVMLNLSRDQLDRFGEVRTVSAAWRRAVGAQTVRVVANADDPLVVHAALGVADPDRITFVGAGMRWWQDAASCPACGRLIRRDTSRWWCVCGLRRPDAFELDGCHLRIGDQDVELTPGVPGRHNVGNAALAVVAAQQLGVPLSVATGALGEVTSVAGRYETIAVGSTRARLLLAKNPAGWGELLGMIDGEDRPVVVAINAGIADGQDTSWLWDTEFERLRGRRVIAAGERASDLAVRLHYGEVNCEVCHGTLLDLLEDFDGPEIDVLANYTVFADLVRTVGVRT